MNSSSTPKTYIYHDNVTNSAELRENILSHADTFLLSLRDVLDSTWQPQFDNHIKSATSENATQLQEAAEGLNMLHQSISTIPASPDTWLYLIVAQLYSFAYDIEKECGRVHDTKTADIDTCWQNFDAIYNNICPELHELLSTPKESTIVKNNIIPLEKIRQIAQLFHDCFQSCATDTENARQKKIYIDSDITFPVSSGQKGVGLFHRATSFVMSVAANVTSSSLHTTKLLNGLNAFIEPLKEFLDQNHAAAAAPDNSSFYSIESNASFATICDLLEAPEAPEAQEPVTEPVTEQKPEQHPMKNSILSKIKNFFSKLWNGIKAVLSSIDFAEAAAYTGMHGQYSVPNPHALSKTSKIIGSALCTRMHRPTHSQANSHASVVDAHSQTAAPRQA